MIRGIAIVWGGLVLALATGLFLLKYEVIALEDDLAALTGAIAADREAIHVLRAEWSYLSEPAYLERLVGSHLDLVPVGPERMTTLAALPFRPVARPDAPAPLAPRVLNPGQVDAIPLPGRKPMTAPRPLATLVTLPLHPSRGRP
ncbi:cell division protein FtsL [Roseospira visakhapatnamensis]|uniref:Cell division protein FtsL n=1 Tax=Roseospira visakhapatnamensis TaxID=390880 RepID=A0A7W6WBH7_9PROT|nr:hypothetical protein [Roseospira visakhapatnamensis]MBB4267516.1 hypothetical protein [Roseospira visakhapatnamensis]